MKIAVPVEGDTLKVVEKTGSAPCFALFEDAAFVTLIASMQPAGQHQHVAHHYHHGADEAHVHAHASRLSGLQGVDVMLFRRVGEHMRQAVEQMGITMKKSRERDGDTATAMVQAFLRKAAS